MLIYKKKLLFFFAVLFLTGGCFEKQTGQTGENKGEIERQKLNKYFHASPQEALHPTRWDSGTTTISNEARLDLFKPALEKLSGGIYIGVGSIQNFTLIAWAKSSYAFLMDFTKIVADCNRIHIAFIKESPTAKDYLKLWRRKSKKARRLLQQYFSAEKDYKQIKRAFRISAANFRYYRNIMRKVRRKFHYKIYFQDEKQYRYIRNLILKNRIRSMKGDLLGNTTLLGMGNTASIMEMKVKVLYLSNAEEYKSFRPYPEVFRRNIINLPAASDAVVLRTICVYKSRLPWVKGSELFSDNGFHYGVQNLNDFKRWLEIPGLWVYRIFKKGGKTDRKKGFTEIISKPLL